ncbi:MAG TPA: hypothetical protein VFZ16_16485 [Hyphomicrobiaceae bacterium]|nr:hypothetical protein [Hyphomicrobiaceae bacterium]
MRHSELDPREVLEKYVAVLREPASSVVRNESELAHPKEAIRIVLQHCIRTATNEEAREFLHNAYASLSNFQQISDAEQEALGVLLGMGPLASEGSKLFSKQARQITHVAAPLQSILDRVTAEHAVLTQELRSLAGPE